MKFWSNLEKEYKELQGEDVSDEDKKDGNGAKKDPKEVQDGEADFQNLLEDINKDIKSIPKEDRWPTFSDSRRKEKSDLVEQSEFDADDAKRALKIGETNKKRDRHCKVGDKIYEVGDRWEDEKTGKEMICILMNIPKEVQPKLADADMTLTTEPVEESPEWKSPSAEPQWSYTASPQKKQGQEQEKCKDDKEEEKQPSVDTTGQLHVDTEQPEQIDKKESENVGGSNEVDESKDEQIEDATETKKNQDKSEENVSKQPVSNNKEPEIMVVDGLNSKREKDTSDSEIEYSESEDEDDPKITSESLKAETDQKTKIEKKQEIEEPKQKENTRESKKDTDTVVEEATSKEDMKEQPNKKKEEFPEDDINNSNKPIPDAKSGEKKESETVHKSILEKAKSDTEKTDNTKDYELKKIAVKEEKLKEDNINNLKKTIPDAKSEENKETEISTENDLKKTKYVTEQTDNTQQNQSSKMTKIESSAINDAKPPKIEIDTKEPTGEDTKLTEEKSKPINMKETVVKRRKIFRTVETIETTEFDKKDNK